MNESKLEGVFEGGKQSNQTLVGARLIYASPASPPLPFPLLVLMAFGAFGALAGFAALVLMGAA